jgi:hypothetical protein
MSTEDAPKPAELPDPDTHCWDDDTGKDVWSYSQGLMRATIDAAVAKERERCACIAEQLPSRLFVPNASYVGENIAKLIRGS